MKSTVLDNKRDGGLPTYVLITPARNEAAFIELTIKSMVRQTILPLKWIIVSDGSTDGTDDLVERYASEYKWIDLVRMPERKERHFAGKVYAFNAGYERVNGMNYDIIGCIDGDISFEDDYFHFLLSKFVENPNLGVGGTPFREGTLKYDYRFTSVEHVSGACQLFRKECFESIGGYMPLKVGGVDLIAVITARMKGWNTRTYTEKTYVHHKKTQAGKNSGVIALFKSGFHDYLMGGHPTWQIFRSCYQMSKKPYFIGGIVLLAGYFWAMVRRVDRPIAKELMDFRRKEQMHRLKDFFSKLFIPRKLLRQ